MKISYIDFWPGFDPDNNWFSNFFRDYFKTNINFKCNPENADLIFGSCFGNNISRYRNCKALKLYFTGENNRPNLTDYDYSLSFDIDSYGGRNLRLPLWMVYIDWWNCNSEDISLTEFRRTFDPEEVYSRTKFCSIMIGNRVSNRIQVVNSLDTYKSVDKFGSVFNNRFEGRKLDLLMNYRYNICFENSIHPGYHTEKFLQAKLAGCIPIYYGADTLGIDFNEKCGINYLNYDSVENLLEYIIELDQDKEKFIEVSSEPLFESYPDIRFLYNFIGNIL